MSLHHDLVKSISVQKWGNSLAIRIPSAIAHRAHLALGSKVEITLVDEQITLKALDVNALTLEQRLAQFDPKVHGGEVMSSVAVGREKLT
ncbi:MAG: AbrB/MazE/SpoVT family DNA-binding domain-containing protein [Legionellaceae bacterium]|nr:AbrB/MazE/SpoVT family DNA-binding domain-containing protein [Legionellaceae bacterium]